MKGGASESHRLSARDAAKPPPRIRVKVGKPEASARDSGRAASGGGGRAAAHPSSQI